MENVDCAFTGLLGLFRVVLCAHVWVYDFPFVSMNSSVVWHEFGWLVCVNRGKLYKSRPSEVISSKRELQNLVFALVLRFSPRRVVSGLSERHSRLGESGSPKRDSKEVCSC